MPGKTTNLISFKAKREQAGESSEDAQPIASLGDLAAAVAAFEQAATQSPATTSQVTSLAGLRHPKTSAALLVQPSPDATPPPDIVQPLARPATTPAKATKRP